MMRMTCKKVVKPSLVLLITALLLIIMANMAAAANFTYHLHNETSAISSSNRQLLTYNPNSSDSYIEGTAALSSTGEKIIEDFETQTGDPNWIGIIPAGSTWTFDVWMSKSSTAATTAYPRVRVRKNNSSGTLILEVTGTTRITNDTTMRKYTLTGTNTSAVTLTASDRLFVTVAVNCTVRVSGTTQKPRLGIEGTAGAANDSTMTTPIPDTTESYHMHNETSAISSLNRQLLLTNPNSSASYVEGTAALSSTGEKIIEDFETQTGDPNWTGTIPAGSTWTINLWMSKSSTAATTAYPRARVRLNSSSGTLIMELTGTTAINNDTTMRKYTLMGTNSSAVTLTGTDRLFVTAAVNCTVSVSGTTQKPRLGIEGTAGVANDSLIRVPMPTDSTPPTTTITTAPSAPDGNSPWFKTAPTITLTSNESSTTEYSWTSSSGPWTTYSAPFTAMTGVNTLYYRSRDAAGNQETAKSQAFSVDNGVPSSTITAPTSGAKIGGTTTYTVTGTAADSGASGVAKVEVSTNGGTSWATASGTTSWSYNWTLPASGSYTIKSRATDVAGNVETPSVGVTVTIDTTAPQVSLVVPANGATNVLVDSNITATFNEDMKSSSVTTSSFLLKDNLNNPVSGSVTYDPATKTAIFIPTADLNSPVMYTAAITTAAQDAAGNGLAVIYLWTFTTRDMTAPVTTITTEPSAPDGDNGWFVTRPNITLTTNETATTYYSWYSSAGPWTQYLGAFPALTGQNTLWFYSVDASSNSETPKSQLFKVGEGGAGIALGLESFYSYLTNELGPSSSLKVNIFNGNLILQDTDLSIPGRGLSDVIVRTYNSKSINNGVFGYGWSLNFASRAYDNGQGVYLLDGDGSEHYFAWNGSTYTRPIGIYLDLVKNANGTYTIKTKDQIKYNYAVDGKLSTIVDRNNNTQTCNYDTNGRITSILDTTGRTITFAYNPSNGKLASITDFAVPARITSFAYDSSGNLTSVTNPANKTTFYNYDSQHNLTSILNINKDLTTFIYTNDRLASIQNANGITTATLTYGTNTTAVTNANLKTATYTFKAIGNGICESIAGPLPGATTTYVIDDNTYNQTKVTDAENNDTDFEYDANGNVTKITNYLKDTNPYTVIENVFTYDPNDNNLLTKENANDKTTTFSYTNGNLTSIVEPLTKTTTFTNNDYGQKESETDARGFTTTYGYNQHGYLESITDPLAEITEYTYDDRGNVKTSKDKRENITTYTYDTLDRLVQTDGPQATPYTKTNSYDALGNKIRAVDANGNTTTYEYDSLNRLACEYNALGDMTQYSYDGAGNKTAEVKLGSPIQISDFEVIGPLSWNDGTADINLFREGSQGLSLSCENGDEASAELIKNFNLSGGDGFCLWLNINDLNYLDSANYGLQIYFYTTNDGYYLLKESTDWNDLIAKVNTYGWSMITPTIDNFEKVGTANWSNITKVKIAIKSKTTTTLNMTFDDFRLTKNSKKTTFTYDDANRIKTVTNPLGNLTPDIPDDYVTTYDYDKIGNKTKVTDANSHSTDYIYDSLSRLKTIRNHLAKETNYEYDALGNKTKETDARNSFKEYEYDDLNKTKKLTEQVTDSTTNITLYDYDLSGNMTSITKPRLNKTAYQYDALNRMASETNALEQVTSYAYDPDGNRVKTFYPMGAGSKGLLGEYYDENNFTNLVFTRIDEIVDFSWALDSPNPSMGADEFSVRWTGQVLIDKDDTYTFYATVDDGVQLYIDNNLVIDKPHELGEKTVALALTKGWHDIKMAHNEHGGSAYAQLRYSSSTINKQIIPANHLRPPRPESQDTFVIADFETGESWQARAGSGGTVAPDIVNYKEGSQGLKLSAANGTTAIADRNATINLAENYSETDLIESWIYVDNVNNADSIYLILVTSDGNYFKSKNLKRFGYVAANGWSHIFLIKSMFEDFGTPDWSTINKLTLMVITNSGQGTVNVTFDDWRITKGCTEASEYDALNRMKAKTDAKKRTTSYEYDPNGNQTKITDPKGKFTTNVYDAANRLTETTDKDLNTTSYGYDDTGNSIRTTDPKGAISESFYDKAGHLTENKDQLGNITKYEYDKVGNQTRITDSTNNTVTNAFNEINLITERKESGQNTSTTYEYDEVGNKKKEIAPNGRITSYEYDRLNRLLKTSYTSGGNTTWVASTYDPNGNRDSQSDSNPNSTIIYEYDLADRLVKTTEPSGRVTEYVLNQGSSKTKISDLYLQLNVSYERDVADQLTRIVDSYQRITNYEYDDNSNKSQLVNGNSMETTYSYTDQGHLENITTKVPGGSSICGYSYSYDENGNKIEVREDTQHTQYDYDKTNQLINTTQPTGSHVAYEYSTNGNRIKSVTDDGSNTSTMYYSYNDRNELTSATIEQDSEIALYSKIDVDTVTWDSAAVNSSNEEGYYGQEAQQFIATESGCATHVRLFIRRSRYNYEIPNPSSADLMIRTDGPSGPFIAKKTITINDIPANAQWVTFAFDKVANLTAGKTYYFTFEDTSPEQDRSHSISEWYYCLNGSGNWEKDKAQNGTWDHKNNKCFTLEILQKPISTSATLFSKTNVDNVNWEGSAVNSCDEIGNYGQEAQQFVATQSGYATNARLFVRKSRYNLTGNSSAYLRIRTGSVTGDIIAEKFISDHDIPASAQWVNFAFDKTGRLEQYQTYYFTFEDASPIHDTYHSISEWYYCFDGDGNWEKDEAQSGLWINMSSGSYPYNRPSYTLEILQQPNNISAPTLYSKTNVNTASSVSINAWDGDGEGGQQAQQFLASQSGQATHAKLFVKRHQAESTGYIRIRSASPEGTIICERYVTEYHMPVTAGWTTFAFNKIGQLTAGTTYFLTFETSETDPNHSLADWYFCTDGQGWWEKDKGTSGPWLFRNNKHFAMEVLQKDILKTYSYDTDGNLTQKNDEVQGTTNYAWNALGQLTSMTRWDGAQISFIYNAQGRRFAKTVTYANVPTTTYYIYDDNKLSCELDSGFNVTATYLYDDKGQPVQVTRGTNTYYYHYNGHGDVVKITDQSKNVVASYAYDAWGNNTSSSGSFANSQPFRYAGYLYDPETGLYYLINRYYDPQDGRFISMDPLKNPTPADSRDVNEYLYVKNNPVNAADPNGLGGSIRGWVLDIETRRPIPGTAVRINNTVIPTESSTGEFLFTLVEPKKSPNGYTIYYDAPGYISQIQEDITVTDGVVKICPTVLMSREGTQNPAGKVASSVKQATMQPAVVQSSKNTAITMNQQVNLPPYLLLRRLRGVLPDYVTLQVNVGEVKGWSGLVTLDRYGNVYLSPYGANIGKNIVPISGSLTGGWIVDNNLGNGYSEEKFLKRLLSGTAIDTGGGYFIGGGTNVTDKVGRAYEGGLTFPQGGQSYHWSFYVGHVDIWW